MSIKQTFKNNELLKKNYIYFKMAMTSISPTLSTKLTFFISKGKKLDLKNPETLDEKVSWLKLNTYNNNPLVTQCADKYAVREYIESCGCGEILNDLYGVYENVNDIPWQNLPNKFVLKLNVGSGANIICSDKEKLNISQTIIKLKKWVKTKRYHLSNAEMQYKYISRKFVCEKYLVNDDGSFLDDYKLYCFDGVVQYVMICVGRDTGNPKFYYYDKEWNLLPLSQDSIDAPKDFYLPKPKGMDLMFEYASLISKPFPFVRTDFYLLNGKPIFGELTFTPTGGIDSGRLSTTDELLGKLVKLPK